MISYLKKLRKQILIKEYILEILLKDCKISKIENILKELIELIRNQKNIIEKELKNISPNSKFKSLDINSVSTIKSTRKWKVIKINTLGHYKTEIISIVNTCISEINNYLAFNETTDEVDNLIVIPSSIRSELKKLKNGFNSIVEELIILKE